MDYTSKFDRRIGNMSGLGVPPHIKDAAIDVNDTLELAWFSAQHVFGKKATPEVAIAIFDRMMAEKKHLAAEEEKEPARLNE